MLTPYDYTVIALSAYNKATEGVCKKYSIQQRDLDILMFLNDNPNVVTATDIVKKLNFSKSCVSLSLRALQERGFVTGEFKGTDRKSIYLKINDSANEILSEASEARRQFSLAMVADFSEQEKKELLAYLSRVKKNLISLSKK